MKSIVIFYNDNASKYKDEIIMDNKSSVQLTADLFKNNSFDTVEGIFTVDGELTLVSLLEKMTELCTTQKADFVIFSYNDLPFLNADVIKELIQSHIEYKAEYTFADGYSYGFAPELIDSGTIKILLELAKTTQNQLGNKIIARDSIYNLIKTDINAFEVETVLAPNDWRLYRFAFHCGTKDNFLQTKNLYEKIKQNNSENLTADKICEVAANTSGCLKTVPGFYNIQISQKNNVSSIYLPDGNCENNEMSYEQFDKLIDEIAEFSENAVVGLGVMGEPLSNPDCIKMIEKIISYKELSVFIETDGILADDEFCQKLEKLVADIKNKENAESLDALKNQNIGQKIMIAVKIDAFTKETYSIIHPQIKSEKTELSLENCFEKAVEAVGKLNKIIPGCVYPQFVRMNQNESELENFFRYWNEKTSPSDGNLIIQKYNDFAGLLPSCKPADLSPLERYPCWHCRRDMTIFYNGDSPRCVNCINPNKPVPKEKIAGNVFKDSLETVWKKTEDLLCEHIEKTYNENCRKCDEYYTFNF